MSAEEQARQPRIDAPSTTRPPDRAALVSQRGRRRSDSTETAVDSFDIGRLLGQAPHSAGAADGANSANSPLPTLGSAFGHADGALPAEFDGPTTPPSAPDSPPHRYTLTDQLGSGGMGVVYGGEDHLGRRVALKVISAKVGGDPIFVERLRREAKVLAGIRSSRIVHVHTSYGPGELPPGSVAVTEACDPAWLEHVHRSPVLVMERVDGETLRERLRRGRMSLELALHIGYLLARALRILHGNRPPVQHRDLKPANVMLVRSKSAGDKPGPLRGLKIVDMGLAHVGSDGTPVEGMSPYYAAPEVVRMESMAASADVWAFGVVLYECLVGARPFVAETLDEYLHAVLFEAPALHRLPTNVPDSIRRLIEHCLAKELADRPLIRDAVRLLQPWSLPAGRAPNNLPASAKVTPFGRDHTVREVAREVQSDRSRLICLHGLPGVGKRRIAHAAALQVANLRGPKRPRVVCHTALDGIDPAASASQIAIRVLAALRSIGSGSVKVPLELQDGVAIANLLGVLGRKPALLVIDGIDLAEQAFSEFAEVIRRDSPATTLLTTSRERPAIFHTALVPIEPLRLPAPDADLRAIARSPAVRYFVEVAQATQLGRRIPLTAANASIIARICRVLGGLPHAIELVAPRTDTLSLPEIERWLAGSLAATSAIGAARGMNSMHAALGLAVDGLAPAERQLLTRLSIFRDGFSLAAAEAVCRHEPAGPAAAGAAGAARAAGAAGAPATVGGVAIVDALCSLRQRHLIARSGDRYLHVEPVRHYVNPTLELEPDVDALRERWWRWFAALIERGLPEHLPDAGPAATEWYDAIEADSENVRHAVRIAAESAQEATALASFIRALEFYWYGRGPMPECWEWCQLALARIDELDTPLQRVRLLAAAAKTAARVGRFGDAERCYRQGVAESTAANLARPRTQLTTNLAMVLHRVGRLDEAEALALSGLEGYRALGEPGGELVNLGTLSVIRKLRGDLDASESMLGQILAGIGHRPHSNLHSAAEQNLGEIDVARGRLARARERFRVAWRGHRGSDRCEELRALAWLGIAQCLAGEGQTGKRRIAAGAPLYRAMLGSTNSWFEQWVRRAEQAAAG